MLSGLINTQEKTMLGIELIRLDGGTQPREGLNEKYIAELVEAIAEGATLPPVDVMYDGSSYWLYDGFHRLAATRHANRASIAATVHQGDQAAAQWESYAANQSHGLRRSTADKERAIRAALKHPTGVKMANNLIAKHLGVSDKTVTRYREIMESASEIPKVTERQGADGKVYSTANIGANRPVAQSPTRRYESGLPALNIPAPSQFGPQPKLPITDWELSDICETVAGEMFGEITRSRVASLTEAMVSDANAQNGPYWLKLLRSLAPFDAPVARIQAAVADAAQRMVAERSAPAPASTMTPEAKQLSREIKAATWGDKPYAEVWEIQNALGRWEHGLTAAELRTLAKYRGGANWFDCRVALGEMRYRDRDLVQALNNIASQMEQRVDAPPVAYVVPADMDSWAAAWREIQRFDTVIDRCQRLAEAMLPWAAAWRDDKDRTWRDLIDRNPQHANSPFRQAAVAECKRRGLSVFEEAMAETIRRLFGLLTSAPAAELDIAAGNAAADEAERQAAADVVAVDDTPLPAWVTGEPAPVSHRDGYDSDEWYTPGWVIEAARSVMGEIDLDPASCELAQETVQAGLYFSKRQDGCRAGWFGRVWLNPPYSTPAAFVDKLIDSYTAGDVKQAVVLLNNSTETRWFQRLLARFPVCFFSQRLEFWRHDHSGVGARQGQAVFYLGPEVERFCEIFGEHGIVVRRMD